MSGVDIRTILEGIHDVNRLKAVVLLHIRMYTHAYVHTQTHTIVCCVRIIYPRVLFTLYMYIYVYIRMGVCV